jgi:hypothetical protein
MTSKPILYTIRYCLFFMCCILAGHAKASDTLTVRQVYSFNVGDTFDFSESFSSSDIGVASVSYSRKVLHQKVYSIDLDTIYLAFDLFQYGSAAGIEIDTITNLDSAAVSQIQIQVYDTSCTLYFHTDTTTYPHYLSNSLGIGCFESDANYIVTKGLGLTQSGSGSIGANGSGADTYLEKLIYYGNDSVRYGTPYYIADGEQLLKYYVPLPEQCAVWTRTVAGFYSNIGTVTEQIRTGDIIPWHGHNLVSLICRIENGITNHFTPDSMIGFFYNDTAAMASYFIQDTNNASNMVSLCDFSQLNGSPVGGGAGYINIDTVLIGGTYRMYVTSINSPYPGQQGCFINEIAGVGSIYGLIPINPVLSYGIPPIQACGSLTCFSICGQTLYPGDTMASCPQLTGIREINNTNDLSVKVSPNPFSSDITITLHKDDLRQSGFTIMDLLGREVYSDDANPFSSDRPQTVDPSYLPAGAYLLHIRAGGLAAVRQIVKE